MKKTLSTTKWSNSILKSTREMKRPVINRSFYLTVFAIGILFSACRKYGTEPQIEQENLNSSSHHHGNSDDFLQNCSGINFKTLRELTEVREATRKYRNPERAKQDNYVETDIIIQNMGFHFLKLELVSPKFDLRKPALLVYNKNTNGDFELVAVEYAVPIDPNKPFTPPSGFTGKADKWDRNTLNSGWWTLHAWVWKFNPDGVFNMMNPRVILPGI